MMKKLLAALGITASLALVGGVAVASIPGPDGVINGCRSTATGVIVVKDSGVPCGTGLTALPWNQTGPAGPAGATGATGPQGPQGIPGTSSSFSMHVVTSTGTIPVGTNTTLVASCPTGEWLIRSATTAQSWVPDLTSPPDGGYFVNGALRQLGDTGLTSVTYELRNDYPQSAVSHPYEIRLTCAS